MEHLRHVWFILASIAGIIYWAARQDSSLTDIRDNRTKISLLENRMAISENGLNMLSVKIDGLRDDVSLIKQAVLK
jgi:hypothetical protein